MTSCRAPTLCAFAALREPILQRQSLLGLSEMSHAKPLGRKEGEEGDLGGTVW
jgi:hypothetical protein